MPGDPVRRSTALTTCEADVVANEGTRGADGEEGEGLGGRGREGDVANGGGGLEDETGGLGLSNVLSETNQLIRSKLASNDVPRTSSARPDLR